MKTLHALFAAAAITLVLGAASALRAGPGPQYWIHSTTTAKPAANSASGQSCVGCPGCAGGMAQAAPNAKG